MVSFSDRAERYDAVQITLHWLTAGFVAAAICLIWAVHLTPRGPVHTALFFLHRSCGVTILGITIVRLFWRVGHGAPPPPDSIPVWQQQAATATHWLLYALLLIMPVTGFLDSASSGHAVSVFYLFDLPMLPENKQLADWAEAIHSTLQWVVYGSIVLHSGAALHHHFIVRDGVLRRMLPTSPPLQKGPAAPRRDQRAA
ncbi:MAG: cytochrome b [Aliidongia sp.]